MVRWTSVESLLGLDLRLIVSNWITIGYDELSPRKREKLKRQLSFVTPKGQVATCYRDLQLAQKLKLPRGAWNLVDLDYQDRRSKPLGAAFRFEGTLNKVDLDKRFRGQSEAVEAMLEHEQGQIIRPPGSGKSLIALAFAARCETTTLILVHTEDILNQWVEYAQVNLPETKIGIIRRSQVDVRQVTIAMVQTIKNFVSTKDKAWWRQFGTIIVDETHHAPAGMWEQILNTCPAYYRFGFTASETRADGMHPYIKFLIGPVIHKQKFSSPVKLTVIPVKTNFKYRYRGQFDWTPMVTSLVEDDERNRQIAKIIDRESEAGNSILVLSRRIEHLERIASLSTSQSETLTGSRSRIDRKSVLERFRNGSNLCVLASQLADEALDVPRLNRIILTHPGRHEGRLIQQVGRIIREFPGKKDAVVYDLIDERVGVLKRQWWKRRDAYRKMGAKIRRSR